MCPHCGRQFTAQIGLFAHLKWRHWPNRIDRCALLVHRGAVYRSTGDSDSDSYSDDGVYAIL